VRKALRVLSPSVLLHLATAMVPVLRPSTCAPLLIPHTHTHTHTHARTHTHTHTHTHTQVIHGIGIGALPYWGLIKALMSEGPVVVAHMPFVSVRYAPICPDIPQTVAAFSEVHYTSPATSRALLALERMPFPSPPRGQRKTDERPPRGQRTTGCHALRQLTDAVPITHAIFAICRYWRRTSWTALWLLPIRLAPPSPRGWPSTRPRLLPVSCPLDSALCLARTSPWLLLSRARALSRAHAHCTVHATHHIQLLPTVSPCPSLLLSSSHSACM
jgi:hypothetical protein